MVVVLPTPPFWLAMAMTRGSSRTTGLEPLSNSDVSSRMEGERMAGALWAGAALWAGGAGAGVSRVSLGSGIGPGTASGVSSVGAGVVTTACAAGAWSTAPGEDPAGTAASGGSAA